MPASIGVNLRVTGHCRQGGRKYMEDFFSVAYQQTEDERDLEYAFFGIYDGHGGAEAAAYAKEHLMELIVRQKNFWSDNDEDVLKAIKDGYIATHYAMWREQAKWPKTASGLPSTAGTTASIAFIRRGKIYIGHVGDSGIVLGYQESNSSDWLARSLTKDHKPESAGEIQRIEQCGGKVVSKSGVPRVVWNRPRLGHQGPIRRSTPIDEIPFLAVARSLGDLWSYNSQLDEFVVSPDPDCAVIPIDTNCFRCLIFGTDGLYNMLSPQMAVHIVQHAEKHNENAALSDDPNKMWINPSKCLVEKALERWSTTKMRADNTSVITLLLDPPGPPRAQVLQNRKRKAYPDSGLEILTRYEGEAPLSKRSCIESVQDKQVDKNIQVDLQEKDNSIFSASEMLRRMSAEHAIKNSPILHTIMQGKLSASPSSNNTCEIGTNTDEFDKDFLPKTRESTSYDPRSWNASSSNYDQAEGEKSSTSSNLGNSDENVQINEVSSSSNDMDEEIERIGPKHRGRAKKYIEQVERPVLRTRNAKGAVEQKKSLPVIPVDKNQVKMVSKQKRSHFEEGENSRQLRVRQQKADSSKYPSRKQHDHDQNVRLKKTLKPNANNCTRVEWLSKAMFRNLIRQKNMQNPKKLHLKNRTTLRMRGRLKDTIQPDLRRSLRNSSMVQVDRENSKKGKEVIVVKKGRGRPQGSKNRGYQAVLGSAPLSSLNMLRNRLER